MPGQHRMLRAARSLSLRVFSLRLALLIGSLALALPIITAHAHGLSAFSDASRANGAQQPGDVRPLVVGTPIERELAGRQLHTYHVSLEASQFIKVKVEQRGIDVTLTLLGADGKRLVEINNQRDLQGVENLAWGSQTAGSFQLLIRAASADAVAGTYEVKIEEWRAAVAADETRVKGEWALGEGRILSRAETGDAIRRAIGKFEEATKLFRETGDRVLEAESIYLQANTRHKLGEVKTALEGFTASLSLFREAGEPRGEARALNGLCVAYGSLGETRKGLDYCQRSAQLWRTVNEPVEEASALVNAGSMLLYLSEHHQALEYLNQALSAGRQAGARDIEAYACLYITLCYEALGEMNLALHAANQSLAAFRALGDRQGEAEMLGQMALVYDALSDYQKALELNQEALRLLQAIGDKWSLGNRVGEQGHILTDVGDYAKAIECFQKALLWQQEAGAPTGATWHGLGRAYALAGARQKAFEAFNQALLLSRKEGRREGELKTLINLGALLQMTGESKQALEYYQQSLQISREIQLAPLVADSLVKLAQVNRELKNEADALRQIEEALSLTETLRLKVAGQEWRSAFLASAQDRYNLHIDLLMQGQPLHENRVKKALEVSERARARSLLEQLGEARADIRRGVDPALLTKERSLQQQLNSKALAQTRLLSGKHTTEQAAAIARELAILTSELKEVEAQIRSTSPHYAALTQPQPLSVAEIQQQLLDADTLLLEYALGEKRSYLWAVTPNSITSYPLPPRAEIEGAAKKVYELLTARQLKSGLSEAQQRERVRKAEAEYATQAALLSQMLLSPVAAQLGHKRLVIVAAGMLEYLPFAALPVPATGGLGDGGTGGQSSSRPVAQSPRRPVSLVPLIADHEIVNLPSASVLAVLRREAAGRQLAANTVAVLADPVFEFNDPRVKARRRNPTSAGRRTRNQAPAQSSLPSELERAVRSIRPTAQAILIRLPFTRDEADAILAVAAGGARLKALDFRANRATAMSDELSRYRIIHLATHGLLNSEQPDLSGLVFSLVDESGKPQDGFLRLHEIYNLRLSSELVVLSACQTGLGKQIKGEGLVGLVRGFMYAGAPRVVASLWQVDDLATAELMKRFYRGLLKEGLRPAAALRAAQLEMSKQRLWSSPYFWAAFVIQGDWK